MKTWIYIVVLILCVLTGCKTIRSVEQVQVPVHDTLWQQHYQVDTMFTDRWHYIDRKGDTVLMVDSVIVYRAKHIHDTIREVNEIPIEVVRTETVEVKKRNGFLHDLIFWLGMMGMLGLASWLLARITRLR